MPKLAKYRPTSEMFIGVVSMQCLISHYATTASKECKISALSPTC